MTGRWMFMRWTWVWAWVWIWLRCEAAVIPPQWVNVTLNPCAKKSWQLLYWPEDHSCHRIFTQGPCKDSQEFYYNLKEGAGACRCPRGTLYHKSTGVCYPEYTKGPCPPRKYLATDGTTSEEGKCQNFINCPPRHVFWPRTNKCYEHHTQGPCLKGYLLYINPDTGFPDCGCDKNLMFSNYWSLTGLCFELFKRGPCLEGDIFLYNATKGSTECSCTSSILTNYHSKSKGCYELNHQGPCNPGQVFNFDPRDMLTTCSCRKDHALWLPNNYCYRLYSRGPCEKGHFFRNKNGTFNNAIGECMPYPCSGTRRYHPETSDCYRLGWRGPCPEGQLFIYDEDSPLRGTCGCTEELIGYWPQDNQCYELGGRGPCQHSQVLSYEKATRRVHCTCDLRKGYVKWHDGHCYRLESRGPCSTGEMLAIKGWRPITPTCTSLNSPVAPNSPLLTGHSATGGESQHHHHQESNSVEAARVDSTFTLGASNDTFIPETTSSTVNTTALTNHRAAKSVPSSHREGRQLANRPAPTNIYSLGVIDSISSMSNEDTTYSQDRAGRSMGDTQTWGFLDDRYFKIPGEDSGSYYTGRPDGARSLTPWWGQIPTSN